MMTNKLIIQMLSLFLMLISIATTLFADIRNYMTQSESVSKNFAIAMTDTNWVISVLSDSERYTSKTILPSGNTLEFQDEWMLSIIKWELRPWYLDTLIKGTVAPAIFIRDIFVRIESRERLMLAPPVNSRWIFILKQVSGNELADDSVELSKAEQYILDNSYYHLNFDATGATCLYWPPEIPVSNVEQHLTFTSTNTIGDLKAIAAVYTPENGGENIPAADITTLENALETDFGRSVLAELLQLHGDPREE